MDTDTPTLGRRAFLGLGAAAVVGVATTTTVAAQSDPDYGGWFDDVSNYDGTTVDATGQSEVRITVGAAGNQGNFAFDPPAVRVDPGTTVVFEWNGEGGSHNVVEADEDGADYESDLMGEAGSTFSLTFDSAGLSRYYCSPHLSLGMKGAVVVGNGEGDAAVSGAQSSPGGGESGGGGAAGGDSGGGESTPAEPTEAGPDLPDNIELYGLALVVAVLSPVAFAALLAARYRGE
ncbi:halocyanin domain-containing protein [Halorarius litoreus]|uniref:halocyanin domain-containing protein n=1 Tax=Halorarius litoreus TaxID=2962676 RepID=UPI003D9CAB53